MMLSGRTGRLNSKLNAAISLPAFFGLVPANKKFFAVTYRCETIDGRAQSDQLVLHALGAFRPESQVILSGSPFIAVSLYLNLRGRIGFQPLLIGL